MPFLILLAFFAVLYNLIIYVILSHGKESMSISLLIKPRHYISSIILSLLLSSNLSNFLVR